MCEDLGFISQHCKENLTTGKKETASWMMDQDATGRSPSFIFTTDNIPDHKLSLREVKGRKLNSGLLAIPHRITFDQGAHFIAKEAE